jgi:hypothetical protein
MPTHLIRRFAQNIVTGGVDNRYDVENKRRTILINALSMVGILNLIPLGVLSLIDHDLFLGVFDLLAGALLIVNLYFLRKTGYRVAYSYFGLSVVGVLFIFLFASGGAGNTGHLWYYAFPLVALFLLGSTDARHGGLYRSGRVHFGCR